mmetsp:Transcript_31357/g.63753  ORF Transcript_31357/g.63753 Transcript_31357/m.63753 type:complete len:124 (-) Transcript_31357:1102-1473(-)
MKHISRMKKRLASKEAMIKALKRQSDSRDTVTMGLSIGRSLLRNKVVRHSCKLAAVLSRNDVEKKRDAIDCMGRPEQSAAVDEETILNTCECNNTCYLAAFLARIFVMGVRRLDPIRRLERCQ